MMKKTTFLLFVSMLLFTNIETSAQAASDDAVMSNENTVPSPGGEIPFTGVNYTTAADGVIYDNGPYFSQAGTPDLSILESLYGSSSYGSNHSSSTGYRVAEDWVVTESVEVTSIDFYAYQTESTTTSTIDYMSFRVWDGNPSDITSTVVYGDDFTNVLTNTTWTGAYRVIDTNLGGTTRPIMVNTIETPGLILTPGTYWLDWNCGGTLPSGPWAPPIAITGQPGTGNAIRRNSSTGIWAPYIDNGSQEPQGLPFKVKGTTTLNTAVNIIESIGVTPNPATDFINISAAGNIENIVIYNVLGQELKRLNPNELNNSRVDISGMNSGIYILKATVNGQTGSFKIVKK